MKRSVLMIAAACTALLTGCVKSANVDISPLMGLEWYSAYDDVKTKLESLTLIDEREKDDQKMQDYQGAELFGNSCDLTLCFTDSGLIGLNYHDVDKNQSYREWHSTLEESYGLPTEEGSGMASWYDDPLGKNTAVFLFNLEEGVQVSVYVTADSPDKDYKKQRSIPSPELRTPVVPVSSTPEDTAKTSEISTNSTNAAPTRSYFREGDVESDEMFFDDEGNLVAVVTDAAGEKVTGASGQTMTTVVSAAVTTGKNERKTTAARTSAKNEKNETPPQTTTTAAASAETPAEPPVEREKAFLQSGLQFYGSPDSERIIMSGYTQMYEYRTQEPGQPWELIMEYKNVPYLGRSCDSVLCFTSLGLVGINYLDHSNDSYSYWLDQLTEMYGEPDESDSGYSAWNHSPVGEGTVIYLFALDDGSQISFFADDSGSELA